jgi:hypothetical protein
MVEWFPGPFSLSNKKSQLKPMFSSGRPVPEVIFFYFRCTSGHLEGPSAQYFRSVVSIGLGEVPALNSVSF